MSSIRVSGNKIHLYAQPFYMVPFFVFYSENISHEGWFQERGATRSTQFSLKDDAFIDAWEIDFILWNESMGLCFA